MYSLSEEVGAFHLNESGGNCHIKVLLSQMRTDILQVCKMMETGEKQHFKCHYVKCGGPEENQGKSDISEWAYDISEQITRY